MLQGSTEAFRQQGPAPVLQLCRDCNQTLAEGVLQHGAGQLLFRQPALDSFGEDGGNGLEVAAVDLGEDHTSSPPP